METKICTSIEQSKKLIKLGIDIDTSDMVYLRSYFEEEGEYNLLVGSYHEGYMEKDDGTIIPVFDEHIPAWSLVALFNVLPDELVDNHFLTLDKEGNEYCCCYEDNNGNSFRHTFADNPVDACYELILKLHELKML